MALLLDVHSIKKIITPLGFIKFEVGSFKEISSGLQVDEKNYVFHWFPGGRHQPQVGTWVTKESAKFKRPVALPGWDYAGVVEKAAENEKHRAKVNELQSRALTLSRKRNADKLVKMAEQFLEDEEEKEAKGEEAFSHESMQALFPKAKRPLIEYMGKKPEDHHHKDTDRRQTRRQTRRDRGYRSAPEYSSDSGSESSGSLE